MGGAGDTIEADPRPWVALPVVLVATFMGLFDVFVDAALLVACFVASLLLPRPHAASAAAHARADEPALETS